MVFGALICLDYLIFLYKYANIRGQFLKSGHDVTFFEEDPIPDDEKYSISKAILSLILISGAMMAAVSYPLMRLIGPLEDSFFRKRTFTFVLVYMLVNLAYGAIFVITTTIFKCCHILDPDECTKLFSYRKMFFLVVFKLSPFAQLFLAFLGEFIALSLHPNMIIVFCMLYPLVIGFVQKLTSRIDETEEFKLEMFSEAYSLFYASLPYKLVYLGLDQYWLGVTVLVVKFTFKMISYVIVPCKNMAADKMREEKKKSLGKIKKKEKSEPTGGIDLIKISEQDEEESHQEKNDMGEENGAEGVEQTGSDKSQLSEIQEDPFELAGFRRGPQKKKLSRPPVRRSRQNSHNNLAGPVFKKLTKDIEIKSTIHRRDLSKVSPEPWTDRRLNINVDTQSRRSSISRSIPGPQLRKTPKKKERPDLGGFLGVQSVESIGGTSHPPICIQDLHNPVHNPGPQKKKRKEVKLPAPEPSSQPPARGGSTPFRRRSRRQKSVVKIVSEKVINFIAEDQFEERKLFTLKYVIHETSDVTQDIAVFTLVIISNYLIPVFKPEQDMIFPSTFVTQITYWTLAELSIDLFYLFLCTNMYKRFYFQDGMRIVDIYTMFLKSYGWFLILAVFLLFFLCFYIVYFVVIDGPDP